MNDIGGPAMGAEAVGAKAAGPRKAVLRKLLTDNTLKALKAAPAGRRYVLWDGGLSNFGVRVTDKGAVTFIVVRRQARTGKLVWWRLGRYPETKLGEARKRAEETLRLLSEGKHPAEIEKEQRREAAQKRRDTFAVAVETFIAEEESRGLRTWKETAAVLRREFLGQRVKMTRTGTKSGPKWISEWQDGPNPIWRNRPILEINRRDIIERLDAIKTKKGKYAARHALEAVRKLFNWCADGERFGLTDSPAARIRDKTLGITKRDLQRKRVLTDEELRDVWKAADSLTAQQRQKMLAKAPHADVDHVRDLCEPLVKLLALTGQRLNDIAAAHWSEIDLDKAVLTVPPERFKTGVAQEVPLSSLAVKILKDMPRFIKGGYVVTTTAGKRPISGITKMKQRLDVEIYKLREKEGREPMPAWRLHDLRRTVRTRLVSDLGIDAFIAERVLGHALPGLHATYDQGRHRAQKRDALARWATALDLIVNPPLPTTDENVVALTDERRRKGRR